MTDHDLSKREWLDQLKEEIIDPKREIIDPHHHLWQGKRDGRTSNYMLESLWADTGSGHNVIKTVFVECLSNYRVDGPKYLKPIGETEFVAKIAEKSQKGAENNARIAGIVAHANLTLGDPVEKIIDAHEEAGCGLLKGIRHSGAWEENRESLIDPWRGEEKKFFYRKDFRQGVRLLGQRGLTYESWLFHHQIKSYIELAKAVPDTIVILEHLGGPLGVGPYEGKREEIFHEWQKDIIELAKCANVFAKIGGMAMPNNGFGWHLKALPPSSDEFVSAQKKYYLHAIECFGPSRCMFESNFPVDRLSISYHVLWNGFKKIVADFSEDEKNMMFSTTATQVYNL